MFVLLAALTLLYTILVWARVFYDRPHFQLVLLAFQYFVLFPALLIYLRLNRQASPSSPQRPPRLVWVIAIFALFAVPLSWFSSRGLLNPDESGYAFQARIFVSGRLQAEPLLGASANVRETPRELFFENHILRPEGWFAKFPPGWPLVLATGYATSMPWLITPLLSVFSLIVMAGIGRLLFSNETGTLAVFLAVLSSFYLAHSIGMMSHALCGLLAVTACFFLFRGLATESLISFAGMFACLSFALQVRPYTALVLALVMGAAALWGTRKNPRLCIRVFGTGAGFAALALGVVLAYNYLYTGHWLVSPYALAAGTKFPPELSFSQAHLWAGIAEHARSTFEESLIGLFPFAYVLAAYALFTEEIFRREVWILALIYLCLVLAYVAHPDRSGVFFGTRFHFEGVFAVFLLAARGLTLLVERWTVSRTAVIAALLLLAFVQTNQQGAMAMALSRTEEPYRKVRAAVSRPDITGVVFLHDSQGFVAKHFNLNDADWVHADRLFLVDAEPERRNDWACRYRVGAWTVVEYNPATHSAVLTRDRANCTAAAGSF